MIVQELHRIQHQHRYLPGEELRRLSQRTGTPLHRLQEVASFFPHFRLEPPPSVEVRVCHDMACHQQGCAGLKAGLERRWASEIAAGRVAVGYASCLGRCDRPVAVTVNDALLVARDQAEIDGAVGEILAGRDFTPDTDGVTITNKPWRIDPYDGPGDYKAVRAFVAGGTREGVIEQLKVADLRGRGGAGVPAQQKWNDVWRAAGEEKYVVCNGDESEPGTFKDRELFTRHPHLVLEGVILAALVTGARRGWIYIRHEYGEQIAIMKREIERARGLGVCGAKVGGGTRDVEIEVFTSPGGYICGEQSALIEAMEDRRAQPRNKPPQLETNGLYDRPTLVSNVETFAWAPAIMIHGGQWYADGGSGGCKGRRIFSLSGDVVRPGVYEVPNGITLRELLDTLAGGVVGTLKAFAASGPSAGFLPARLPVSALPRGWEKRAPADLVARVTAGGGTELDILDLNLDLQRFRDLGLAIGAGLVVYNDQRDMLAEGLNCSQFFRDESCGKCVPCRLGSEKIVHVAEDLVAHRHDAAGLALQRRLVDDLTRALEMTSICGLGMVAAKPLQTALQFFPADVERHLRRTDR